MPLSATRPSLRPLRHGSLLRLPRGSPGRRLRGSRAAKLALAMLGAAALLGGAWLWLRDSSLVAIRSVAVTGVSGRDAGAIRAALSAAARRMTTLDLQRSRLRAAVAAYPQVIGLRVSAEFPHSVRIMVLERVPVGVLTAGGHAVVVDSDGQLLPGWSERGLPRIPLRALPPRHQVTPGHGLAEVRLLAAAPWQLIEQIADVTQRRGRGLIVTLRHGPIVYFGNSAQAPAKWAALVAVLASPGAAGAGYIDVADPEHPATGGGSVAGVSVAAGSATLPGASAAGSGTGGASATTATTPAAPSGGATTPAGTGTVPAAPAG